MTRKLAGQNFEKKANEEIVGHLHTVHRVQTEWPWPISGVHSIMRVGGARPPPFTLFSFTYKVAVYASAERADTLSVFISTLYVLCGHL
jgi:hypothetical protein